LIAKALVADQQDRASFERFAVPFRHAFDGNCRVIMLAPAFRVLCPALRVVTTFEQRPGEVLMGVDVVGVKLERAAIEHFLFVEAPLRAQRAAQAYQIGGIRLECDRATIALFGFGVVAQLADGAAQIDMRVGKTRPQFESVPEVGDGLGTVAFRRHRVARIEVRIGRVRIERQRLLIASQRLVVLLEFGERGAQIQMRVDERRIERQRLTVLAHGAFVVALRLQGDAEVIARVRESRLQLQRLPIAPACFFVTSERGGDEAAVAPADGVSGFELERVIQQVGRGCVVAPLVLQHAVVVQRFRVNRVDRQRFLIERRGLFELTRTMRVERISDEGGEV
jgi:hypothetical protein